MSASSKLWGWFGLSRASFLVMPRVLMHEMPEDWQNKMAHLLEEFDDAFPGKDRLDVPYVLSRRNNKFVKWPSWLLNYRHPKSDKIEALRKP